MAALRSIGIQPDAIVCRSDRPISGGLKRKISLMCDVDEEAVVSAADALSIYDIPKVLHSEGLDAYVVRRLGLPFRDVDWSDWDELLRRVHRPARSVTIALVGKYVDLPDAYLSPAEALRAGGFGNDARVNIRWVTSDDCETPEGAARQLDGVDGVLVPGGFGVRGIEGKIGAVRLRPRERHPPARAVPRACSAWPSRSARDLAGLDGANSAEFDPHGAAPGDRHDGRPGGRGGRGAGHGRHHAARPVPGRAGRGQPGPRAVRHRRGGGAAPAPVRGQQRLPGHPGAARAWSAPACRPTGSWWSSSSCRASVHPFFVATQAHPEFLSRPTRPHPLFSGLVEAALERSRAMPAAEPVAAAGLGPLRPRDRHCGRMDQRGRVGIADNLRQELRT